MKYLKYITPFLLAGIFFCLTFQVVQDWPRVDKQYRIWRMNRLAPQFSYLASFAYSAPEKNTYLLEEAVTYYKNMVKLYPLLPEAYALLGFFEQQLGRMDVAAQAYQKSLELQPQQFWTQYNLGTLFLAQGKEEDAKQAFRAALQIHLPESMGRMMQSLPYRQIMAFVPKEYSYEQKLTISLKMAQVFLVSPQMPQLQEQMNAVLF